MAFRLRACGSNDGAVFDVFPTRCAAMRASSRFIFPIFYRPAIRNSSSMIPERFRGHAAPPLPDGADRADRQKSYNLQELKDARSLDQAPSEISGNCEERCGVRVCWPCRDVGQTVGCHRLEHNTGRVVVVCSLCWHYPPTLPQG
jgi:hypothetical protein